ncbi:MAG: radical SAM protein [Candidatus Omnitrophota bacterium]|nr:radical SAM protein [Candidatus Omnitrophota bacterium]
MNIEKRLSLEALCLFNSWRYKFYHLPFVFICVNNYCNARCIMCDIWKEPHNDRLSLEEIEGAIKILLQYKLKEVVISGGEPLLHPEITKILKLLKEHHLRVTLCTNGMLLKELGQEVACFTDKLVISLDGDTAPLHDSIRGVPSFDQVLDGIEYMKGQKNKVELALRCTIQKSNFLRLDKIIEVAKSQKVESLSFAPVYTLPGAFGRHQKDLRLALEEKDLAGFILIIKEAIRLYARDFNSGFISTSPQKLFALHAYFRSILTQTEFKRSRCILPWVSLVIEPSGDVHPCFFKESIGNLRQKSLREILCFKDSSIARSNISNAESCNQCNADFWRGF